MMNRRGWAASVIALAMSLSACGGGEATTETASGDDPGPTINVAYQPGLSYAPFVVMKVEGLIEEEIPGVEVEWQTLGSGTDIRDAIQGGRLDIGAGGVPPILIGIDTGVPYKIAGGMNNYPSALLTMDDSIQSLADIGPEDKIAVTTPGATQDLTLRKLADEQFGEPNRFEDQLLALPHPDAVAALETGAIAVHGSNTPFQNSQIAAGARSLGDLYDAFGESTLIVAYAGQPFHDERPEQYAAFRAALAEALRILQEEPERAAEALASEQEGADVDDLLEQITDPELTWTETPTGTFAIAEFMAEIGLLSEPLDDWRDVVWPDVAELEGS